MSLNVQNDDLKTITKSPFSIYKDEEIKFDGRISPLSLDNVMLKVKQGHIKAIDFEILFAISNLRYATSRQVSQYIQLFRDIQIDQTEVQSRLNYLNRSSIISRYKYINKENGSESNLRIYCLERYAKILLTSRLYKCNWVPTDSATPELIKKFLARNQVLLTLKDKAQNVTNIDIEKCLNSIKTDLYFELDNREYYYVEVFRKNQSIEIIQKILSNYSESFKGIITNKPKLVILCEEDIHCFEIYKIILKNEYLINCYFSTDLRVIQKNINEIFINFKINDKKVSIQEINNKSIIAKDCNTTILEID